MIWPSCVLHLSKYLHRLEPPTLSPSHVNQPPIDRIILSDLLKLPRLLHSHRTQRKVKPIIELRIRITRRTESVTNKKLKKRQTKEKDHSAPLP